MASAWTEHRAPDGRLYWHNATTQASVWERPDELKSPAERALATTPWKEYQTPEGRKYWHHTQTKQTTWTLPAEVKAAVDKAMAEAAPTAVPASPATPSVAASASAAAGAPAPSSSSLVGPGSFAPPPGLPPRPTVSFSTSIAAPMPVVLPDFKTPEEAEGAFINMLRERGVTSTWTWEQTMRHIITDPYYKALDTMAARKAAYEKYVDGEKRREAEQREKNIAKVRPAFRAGLDKLSSRPGLDGATPGPGVRTWWTFGRFQKEVEARAPEIWKLSKDDEERRVLLDEYLTHLRRTEEQALNELRGRQQPKLEALIHSDTFTTQGRKLETVLWRDFRSQLNRMPEFRDDDDLKQMEDIDILAIFEEEVKRAERDANEVRQREKAERRRTARKARAGFIALLTELKLAGHIEAGSMWKDTYPLIEPDERYQKLLGIEGSTPLDLFWDVVDELELKLEDQQRVVEGVLTDQGNKVEESTDLGEFKSWVSGNTKVSEFGDLDLKRVFIHLQERAIRLAKEDRRRAEKRLRNMTEDLRYALKKVSPPVDLDTPYEAAVPRFSDLPEYVALEGHDDLRQEAYNRYMERLKEKAEEKRKRSQREEERDRDRKERAESRKTAGGAWSDDEGSVTSGPKKRRKEGGVKVEDDDRAARHSSPRSGYNERVADRDRDRRKRDYDDEDRYPRHHRASRRDDRDDREPRRASRYDDDRKDRDRERDKRGRSKDRGEAVEDKDRNRDKDKDKDKARDAKRPRLSEKEDGEEGELEE